MILSTIRTFFLALLLACTCASYAAYDKIVAATNLDSVSDEIRLSGDGYGTVGFQLTGTWTATVTFEASVYGTTWIEVTAYNRTGGAGATTTEENGAYVVSSAGMRYVRARVSAYTSGTIVAVGLASPEQSIVDGGSSAGGGGGAEGSVDVLSIAAGNNNIGNVDVVTLPALVAGTANIGDVDVLSLPATPAGNNNIGDVDVASIAAGDNNIGNVDIVSLPTVTINSPAVTNAGTFAVQNTAATPAGTNNIGDVDILSIAAGDNNIGNVDIVSLPTVTVNSHAVTNAGTFAVQAAGAAAHDAAASGGPVQTGGVAQTADPTAVTAGDATYSLHTIGAKQVVMPYSISGSRWSYAAASGGIVNTTAVTVKAAAAAGIKNCITSIQVINAHATVSTETLVLDGAAGTVLHRGWAQAAGGGYAHEFPVPICGTAATLLEVDNVTTGAAVYYNLQGYTSAE